MALIQCDFFSNVLGLSMSMNVILPQDTNRQIGMEGKTRDGKLPCLYLLHGLSDDHSIWLRRTSIERYVADKAIAVVMPAAHKSWYCDLKTGDRYWEYISEEVPQLTREFFPISDKREDNFVAGLSMGGYGAFKLALNKPEQYSAAASLSGSVYIGWEANPEKDQNMKLAFDSEEGFKTSINNLVHVAQELNNSTKPKPRLYQCCGTEDFLYEDNQKYKAILEKLDFDYTYEEDPGSHGWGYWDMKIQRVLDWLQL